MFAWSFYSQGTREQIAASSDLFLREALGFFGDQDFADSARSGFDKGRRLAQLVAEKRALLILDGLEPLQYAPTSAMAGQLKDQRLGALLKGLAVQSRGLCVVTSRYSIVDLKAFWQSTAPEINLSRLSMEAGIELLESRGVQGNRKEFEKLVEEVKGHALTLNLLGTYLSDAYAGDIRKRDRVKLEEADAEEQDSHAFRVMDAYVKWMAPTGFRSWLKALINKKQREEQQLGKQALSVLRLMGLFDRPADAGCLEALFKAPAIPNLCESLIDMKETQRNVTFKRLENARLLTVNRDKAGNLLSLDAHPLLREYFAGKLRTRAAENCVKQEDWINTAADAIHLSELELTLGEVAAAVAAAEYSVIAAECSGDAYRRMYTRTTHADALHQAGRPFDAQALFREAEDLVAETQPAFPLLYSLQGFRYCDLLHRARLFGLTQVGSGLPYPWGSAQQDLAEARRLIEKHGYLRRKQELEDAEAVLKNCRSG